MGDLFEELRSAGQVDSKGVFTIDPQRARETLRKAQLESPQHYVLLLLSAAIAGGARYFHFHRGRGVCEIRYDGQVPTCEELANLYSRLFGDTPERRLSDLAIALNALPHGMVELLLWDGERAGRFDQLTLTPEARAEGEPQVCIRVRHGWLEGFRRREEWLLQERAYAPLQLSINGKMAGVYLPPRGGVIVRYLRAANPDPRYHLPLGTAELPAFSERASPGPWSAVIWIDSDPQPAKGISVVVDGMEFLRRDLFIVCPEINVTVAAPELKRNLSCTDIVLDERWELVRQGLARGVLETLADLPEQWKALARPARLAVAHALNRLPAQVDWAIGFEQATEFYQDMLTEEVVARSGDLLLGAPLERRLTVAPTGQLTTLFHMLSNAANELERQGNWRQAIVIYQRMLALLPKVREDLDVPRRLEHARGVMEER
ncbi:MAG: hypothetical protein ACYCW6_03935 [Candidatus Xenobia bacterium]